MATKRTEYLLTVDKFNEPQKVNNNAAVALLLVRLILLQPGSDPLHPDMGVGLKNYRYSLNQLEELKKRISEQIDTYLPEFQDAAVALIQDPKEKLCNIEITIDDVVYVYNSSTSPIPIRIADINSN